jgi:hypothetical protein
LVILHTDGDGITKFDTESGGDVGSQVFMPLLVTVYAKKSIGEFPDHAHPKESLTVLGDIVQVVTADNDRSLHLGANNTTGQDATTDADVARERALFVDVGAIDSLGGSFESQTDILVPPLLDSELAT